jgi:septal ring factor EnvC (AmiA/AmiB activator)
MADIEKKIEEISNRLNEMAITLNSIQKDLGYIKQELLAHENRLQKVEDDAKTTARELLVMKTKSNAKEEEQSEIAEKMYRRFSWLTGILVTLFTAINVIIKII